MSMLAITPAMMKRRPPTVSTQPRRDLPLKNSTAIPRRTGMRLMPKLFWSPPKRQNEVCTCTWLKSSSRRSPPG
jgi:hypothetical protein